MDKTFIRRHEEQNYTHNLLPEGTEKPTVPGDDHVMICLEVLGMHIDEDHLEDRTGEEGLLYNIHYQMNPEHVMKTGHDYAAVLQKKIDVMEY